MKKVIPLLFLVFLLVGCASLKQSYKTAIDTPTYLNGKVPDETSNYSSTYCTIITHTYFCYGGEYIVITWTRPHELFSMWHKSIYRTNGICKK
jgi:hypothetical protein